MLLFSCQSSSHSGTTEVQTTGEQLHTIITRLYFVSGKRKNKKTAPEEAVSN
jgi:hypothetical protein